MLVEEKKTSISQLQLPLDWIQSSNWTWYTDQLHYFFQLGCSRNPKFVSNLNSNQLKTFLDHEKLYWNLDLIQSKFILRKIKILIRYTLFIYLYFWCEGQSLSGVHGTVYAMQQAFNEVAPNICLYAPIELYMQLD